MSRFRDLLAERFMDVFARHVVLGVVALSWACTSGSTNPNTNDDDGGGGGGGESSRGGSGSGGASFGGTGGAGSVANGGNGVGGTTEAPGPAAVVGKGMLDCPAVAAPTYTLVQSAGATLSYRFASTCAGCHGPAGAGRPGYPAIPGTLTVDQYKAIVRAGKGTNMPAFDATAITDAEIAADFATLRKGATGSGQAANTGRTHPKDWTDAKRAEVMKKGLVALRKPDKYGTACVNCHSPDAIELAAIAFTDDDILRRGLQHVSSEDALDIVDYVHAMRAKYDVKNPCSKLWRPFQPGGEPLPGNTLAERELAFGKELEKRNLAIYTKPITSLAEAKAAADAIEAVSLRTLPVGVAFPRWSEDSFNGAAHRSFNDWMPGGGRVPKNPSSWYAMHDKYIADPTIQNLSAIHEAMSDGTILSKADSHGREISANFSVAYNAQGWMEDTLLFKHQSVLAGAHFFRLALTKQPGWLELPALPFPELNKDYGPFFHQGLHNAEPSCYSNKECDAEVLKRLPEFMREELEPNKSLTYLQTEVLSDPWAYLGQLMDHTLLTAENFRGPTIDGHYWNLFTFEHRYIQQPFFSAHRLINQEAYFAKYKGTPKLPTGRGLPKTVHPLLHGDWTDVQGLDPNARIDDDDARLGPSLFLRANVALMFAYLQRDLLQKGSPVAVKTKLLGHLDQVRAPAQQMAAALERAEWAKANPRNRDNATVLVTGALKIFSEVESLIKAAPVVVDGDVNF
ncbi:MAG: cytochrome c [Deltaproteobacteria bacterium]|nr:cytochrome c [Deltaproteobacteria bacterium]